LIAVGFRPVLLKAVITRVVPNGSAKPQCRWKNVEICSGTFPETDSGKNIQRRKNTTCDCENKILKKKSID
jgi:hypothetical protein